MKVFRIKNITILFAILAVAFTSSCGNEEEQKRISREERRAAFVEDSLSLKVGVLPTEDCYQALVAEKLSLFEKVGVTVHLRHYGSLSECRIALKNNMIEGAYIDSTLMKIVEEKDATPLDGCKPTNLSWKMIACKLSRVSKVAQLNEKVVAADSHGDSHVFAELAIDSLVRKQQNVFVVQCEDVNVRYRMLSVGNVDVAMLPEPFASKAVGEGHKVIKDYSQKKKGVLAFRKSALADKRIKGQYDLFLKALDIANDSIRQNGIKKYI